MNIPAALPWLLLASTLGVRFALARKWRWGFYLDLLSVVPWLAFYYGSGAYPLLPIPFIFGWLDIKALTRWWR